MSEPFIGRYPEVAIVILQDLINHVIGQIIQGGIPDESPFLHIEPAKSSSLRG